MEVKKLVLILATSTSLTGTREEALTHISYIYYLVQFKKNINQTQIQVLINSESEVNTIHLTFVKKLDFSIRPIEVGAQKIDGTTLNIYGIIVAAFLVIDKANQVRFFEEPFLVTNVSLKVVFKMPFLTLSGINIDFLDQKLR